MGKDYKISEYDETKKYKKDDVFVLNDRPRKFDEKSGKFVKPGEPGYDDLPDIIRGAKNGDK